MLTIRIALAILIVCFAGARDAVAESEHVGPLNLAVRVNGVELSPALDGTVAITTAKGDFNANLDLKLSSPTLSLANDFVAILKTLLPIKIPTPKCSLLITEVRNVSISSRDDKAEADIDAALVMALRSCLLNRENVQVRLSVAVIPAANPPNQIKWKIVRQPVLELPESWFLALEITQGSPQQVLQRLLDGYAFTLPQIKGIRASVQGANFDGDQHNLSFRIKADAHASGVGMTSLLTQLLPLLKSNLDFKFEQPK